MDTLPMKRATTARMIADPEWSRWSGREIARRCGVDNKTVEKLRKASEDRPQMPQEGVSNMENTTVSDKSDGFRRPEKAGASI